MKFAFSTKNIESASFLELCNKTAEYGFSGFEIFDAKAQKKIHDDSIFRSSMRAGAKRKLVNRHIDIASLKYPTAVCGDTDAEDLALIHFDSVSESYISENNKYVVGHVSLGELHRVQDELRRRNVFIAAYPRD